ncbi:MAG: DUF3087 domain-containing protein [Cellvibrio sp.]|uniref:DUF3087 domain-containing protein n=1 Tax=Cellvibrio sp. TaxID=1965322 RepID=UPI0031A7A186
MQLIDIDKARYRKHLKIVFISCAVSLAVGSLALSQTLIAIFPNESGSHFHWNLLGVVVSAVTIGWLLNKYRKHDYMREVTYVWELKQALNKITRKIRKIEAAALEGDRNALLAMQFSYAGSRLVWQLDDNTLTLDALVIKQHELDRLAEKFHLTLSVDDYDEKILAAF